MKGKKIKETKCYCASSIPVTAGDKIPMSLVKLVWPNLKIEEEDQCFLEMLQVILVSHKVNKWLVTNTRKLNRKKALLFSFTQSLQLQLTSHRGWLRHT